MSGLGQSGAFWNPMRSPNWFAISHPMQPEASRARRLTFAVAKRPRDFSSRLIEGCPTNSAVEQFISPMDADRMTLQVRNPATLALIDELPVASPADVAAALARAQAAQRLWQTTTFAERAQILYRLR